MENLRFSSNGWTVHLPNPEQDPNYDNYGASGGDAQEFQDRRPVLANDIARAIYLGEPGWYHHNAAEHHGVDEWGMHQGYFGGGPLWGKGKLKWYHGGPDTQDHNDIAESLREVGFDIPHTPDKVEDGLNKPPAINWDDDDDTFLPHIDIAG